MTATVPLGRETELAHLVQALHRVRDSGVVVVLVTGPRGVGRSTLLTAVGEQHTGPVCRAVGAPWETHHAGAVLAQLAGAPSLPPDPLDAAAQLRSRVADPQAVTLLVVDDAHHADLHSLQVLATLRRHHSDAPVCVLLAAPSGPGHGGSPEVLELLAGVPDRRVVLEPLDGDALVRLALARGIAVAPWVVEPLHRHTGGLPGAAMALFEELPRATWSDPHPELPAPAVVAARVAERLPGLPPDARRLVEAACVLEDERSLALAARLAGVEDVWPAVDSATRAGLLTLRGPAGAHEVGPPDP
ncbi:MAG TPA: ATP-binding protein, partial [Intrasporangium sp.]|uniref:ATP-binding protein n=1 Tax=Intrasporangium sp. TaxID=1925024 RepID=UPI002D76AA36